MGLTQKLGTIPLAILTDASNNVGIGGSPSGSYKLEVTGTAKVSSTLLVSGALTGAAATFSGLITYSGTSQILNAASGTTGYLYQYLANTTGAAYFGLERSTGGGLFTGSSAYATVLGSATATSLQFGTNGIIRATIDSAGAATFSSTVQANGAFRQFASSGYYADFAYNGSTYNLGSSETTDNIDFKIAGGGTFTTGGNFRWFTQAGGSTPLERMRITSGGNTYFGNSAGGTIGGMVQIDALNGLGSGFDGLGVKTGGAVNAIPLLLWNAYTTGDIEFARFYSGASSNRGNIFYSTTNGQLRFSGAAAGTYSDARLKDIKGECSYGLDTISKIKVYDFNWLRNGNKGFGVKAQEIYDLIPEVVEVGNDKEIDPMEFDYQDIWKVNYNELIPVLVKAIQELSAQNQDLKSRLDKAGL
jgi:hypothetical protein